MGSLQMQKQGWQVETKSCNFCSFQHDDVSFERVKLFKFTCVCPLQLEKCGVEFDELHVKYNQLYCASFDADPATLASLNMYPYAKEFLVIVVCFIYFNFDNVVLCSVVKDTIHCQ